jgi:hypothetical protein
MRKLGVLGAALLCVSVEGCSSIAGPEGAWVKIDSAQISKEDLADGESMDFSWHISHTKESGYVTEVGLFVGSEEAIMANAPDTQRLFDRAVTGNIQNDASASTVSCTRKGNALGCGGGYYDLPANEAQLTFRACASYVLSTEESCDYRAFMLTLP